MIQVIMCFPYRSANACYVLKAEETSAGKAVKARKQKPRGMNYAKVNLGVAICDIAENTAKYFVNKKAWRGKLLNGF